MKLKQLGNTDMQITPLGIGAWAMGGGGWQFGWGKQEDNDSIAAIHAALDAGMNWIDTAAVYGLGRSEQVVAQALKGRAKRPYVFTKCELVWNAKGEISGRLKAASIRREIEASLKRLQLDVIDLYQIHWPDPPEDIEEGWQTLAELKKEGKVRWIAVSNFNAEQMERARKIAPISSLQPPYSILKREIEEEILPYCARHNIGVIAYSTMQSGLLTGEMTRKRIANFPKDDFRKLLNPHFQEPALTRNLELAELLRDLGNRHGRTAGEAAIAWTLRCPEVTAAIIGVRSAKQVEGVIGAMEFRLQPQEIDEIRVFMKSWQRKLELEESLA
ncbi:MAG TPA: aldo/keto reductase [Terriglobales bacterium]|jgi:aryl-alcohol dehydrogenase-like predicted oxidoreductase|nr:aldo/keto reductase [Terriglobales bacterium]